MEKVSCLLCIEVITQQVSSSFSHVPNYLAISSSVNYAFLTNLFYVPIEAKYMFGAPAMQGLTKTTKNRR